MADLAQLNAFLSYVDAQYGIATIGGTTYGQPYVGGAQHLRLTPGDYQAIIHNKEDGSGSYPGGLTFEQAAKDYCARLFDAGLTELYAYDCSGLGMYWLQNVEHIYPTDYNANIMMGKCTLYRDDPARGWWVFLVNANGRATHIGYMVDNTHVVEAKGRMWGVTKSVFNRRLWNKWGIPKIWEGVIPAPGDPHPGHTWSRYTANYIFCPGGGYFFPPH